MLRCKLTIALIEVLWSSGTGGLLLTVTEIRKLFSLVRVFVMRFVMPMSNFNTESFIQKSNDECKFFLFAMIGNLKPACLLPCQ